MAHEIEAGQVDSLIGIARSRRAADHAAPAGSPCANCATALQGPWCHACGQLAEDFHRSWIKLAAESVEGLLHFDGRFWSTLPDLVLRPGRLTRRYLDGHRAPQIPPLRLFLVVLLIVFLAKSINEGHEDKTLSLTVADPSATQHQAPGTLNIVNRPLDDARKAEIRRHLSAIKVQFGDKPDERLSSWLRDRIARVIENPKAFALVVESWSERFAFLMLPLAAALLSLIFVSKRGVYLFDHLVFSMHSLSFVGLLLSGSLLLDVVAHGWGDILLLAAPVHLFFHMRSVYGGGAFGTLARMTILSFGSMIGFVFLATGLIFVGLMNI